MTETTKKKGLPKNRPAPVEDEANVVALAPVRKNKRRRDPKAAAELREKIILRIVREMNRKHAWAVRKGNMGIIMESTDPVTGLPTFDWYSESDLRALYRPRKVLVPKVVGAEITLERLCRVGVWMSHPARRTIAHFVNAPGRTFTDPTIYNIWRGWGVEPARNEDGTVDHSGKGCPRLMYHLRTVVCHDMAPVSEWLTAWLANLVQEPEKKPRTAVFVQGGQGSGKDFIAENVLGPILASAFMATGDVRFLTAEHNTEAEGKLLINAQEAIFAGDPRIKANLKTFITNPEMEVNPKHQKKYKVPNHARVWATSDQKFALNLDNDDRRWLVLRIREDYRVRKADQRDNPERWKRCREYFELMLDECRNGGLAAFFGWLLDPAHLLGVDLRTPPVTPWEAEQKLHSLPSVERWWYECLTSGAVNIDETSEYQAKEGWPEKHDKKKLHKRYLDWCQTLKIQRPEADASFHAALQRLAGADVSKGENRQAGLYETRSGSGPRNYVLPALDVCRSRFAHWLGSDPAELWPDEWPLEGCSDMPEETVAPMAPPWSSALTEEDNEIPF